MMLKKLPGYLFCFAALALMTWLYMVLSAPAWWNEKLHLKEVVARSNTPKPVYETHQMKKVLFQINKGDKCYWIANAENSFGEPDRKDLEYRKMLVICPGAGIGWVTNSW